MIDEILARQIRDRANIYEVVEEFLPGLKKSGKDYTTLCPFHDDRHAGNFKVNTKRNIFHCFTCGASGDSVEFLMRHANYTYPEAIRYLAAKYGYTIEGSEKYHPKPCKPTKREPLPPLPLLTFPQAYLNVTRDLSNDNLYKWIVSLPWKDEQRSRIDATFRNYLVGHTRQDAEEAKKEEINRRDNFTIFWQADDKGRIRTGKMLKYKPDGHKMKKVNETDYTNDFIHARLSREYERNPKEFVAKRGYNPNDFQMEQTLFGLHLIDFFPEATVNVVESEKTAIFCTIYFGNQQAQLWIATGSMAMLKPDIFKPLLDRKRKISLYPDIDGIDQWQAAAEGFNSDLIKIQSDFIKENWIPEDGPKADLADILVRMMSETKPAKLSRAEQTIAAMTAINPAVSYLIEKLQLTPIIEA